MSRAPTARQAHARAMAAAFDDLPDGAFFAVMEEMGVDVEDLIDDEPELEALPHRTCRRQQCRAVFATKRARNQHERDKHGMHGGPALPPRNPDPARPRDR